MTSTQQEMEVIKQLPRNKQKAALAKIAKQLKRQGYSGPQAAKEMGYKTAQSVYLLWRG